MHPTKFIECPFSSPAKLSPNLPLPVGLASLGVSLEDKFVPGSSNSHSVPVDDDIK